MNDVSSDQAPLRAGWSHRLLGGLILIKASLPIILVVVLTLGVWQVVAGVARTVEDTRVRIKPTLALVQKSIDDVHAESARLLNEVKKIENATTEVVGSIKQSVEPIRRSLLGLSSAVRVLSTTVVSLLNGIVRTINAVPGVKDLPYVRLPKIEVPGIALPKLNIDVNLKPNLEAVHQFNEAAQEIARQAQTSVDRIADTIRFWWWTVQMVAAGVLLWGVLALVGYVGRVSQRIYFGFRMLRGYRVQGAWALL